MNFIVVTVIALILGAVFLAIFFLFWKGIDAVSGRLPPIESFLPFPRQPVRIAAVLFGIIGWSTLLFYLFEGDRWRTFDAGAELKIITPSGEAVLPKQQGKAIDVRQTLARATGHGNLALDSDTVAETLRDKGIWRLSDLINERPAETDLPIFIQANSKLIPAFELRETFSSDAQPIWRGWIDALFNKEGHPGLFDVNLWCGFDLTSGQPERFCFMVVPMPLFLRLYLDDVNSLYENGATLSAPLVFLRLDQDGAHIVGSQLTQHDFDTPKGRSQIATPESFGLSFSLQDTTDHLNWRALQADTWSLGLSMKDQDRLQTARFLWSRREIHGTDKWIFATKGKAGLEPQLREIQAPELINLAYDFLFSSRPRITNPETRKWLIAHMSARAILATGEKHTAICRNLANAHKSVAEGVIPDGETIQYVRRKTRQRLMVGLGECPIEILPLLFLKSWTGSELALN